MIERTIWMLWLQGFDNAPPVIQVCLRSWKARNPTWKVVQLTDDNLSSFIDAPVLAEARSLGVTPQIFSDLVRLELLRKYGGVWADATCFCCQPLDSWLPESMPSGFFAFRNPGRDRIVSNWFIASTKENPLITGLQSRFRKYLKTNRFPLQGSSEGRRRVKKMASLLNRNSTLSVLWTSTMVARIVKAYPYFIFHYHFARTVWRDKLAKRIWNQTPWVSADGPHKMYKAGVLTPMTSSLLDDLENCRERMYKLTWKFEPQAFREGCILDYIIRSV